MVNSCRLRNLQGTQRHENQYIELLGSFAASHAAAGVLATVHGVQEHTIAREAEVNHCVLVSARRSNFANAVNNAFPRYHASDVRPFHCAVLLPSSELRHDSTCL